MSVSALSRSSISRACRKIRRTEACIWRKPNSGGRRQIKSQQGQVYRAIVCPFLTKSVVDEGGGERARQSDPEYDCKTTDLVF